MNREEAYNLLTIYLTNKNLIKHSLACEAGMKAIYKKLHTHDYDEQTENDWGITGLLHDVDYEIAQNENLLDKHGLLIFEREPTVFPDHIAHGIKAHNFENTRVLPENDLDWAIACVDQLTGLITAVALVRPEKSLSSVTTESVLKKFPNPSFAKGANREAIARCEKKLGIPLDEFITITITAMQSIHDELGL
jgi:uncharacterized protein